MARCAGLLFALLASPVLAQPRFVLESTEVQTVEAVIRYQIEFNRFTADRWMIYLPRPPELPGQLKVKASTTPASKLLAEKSPLARPVFFIDQRASSPALARKIEVELKIEASLLSRKLVPVSGDAPAAKVPPLKEVERKYFTASSTLVDFDTGLFREWMEKQKLKRQVGETDLALAERVLEAIRTQFEYGFDSGLDQRASLACSRNKADCGGMTFIFVGALRANGIPARPLIGRMAKPRKPDSRPSDLEYDNPHVRAEFFVPDLGWVPVDPSAVQGNRKRTVASFLGHDDGDFLVLHTDVDLMLPFRDRVERAGYMQVGPYYHAYGNGTFDATFGPNGWSLKVIPAKK